MTTRLLTVFTLGATLLVAGCGGAPNTNAPSGTEVVQDGVGYFVQTSRELNPLVAGDRALLAGVPKRELQTGPRRTLVGVFLQAANDGKRARHAVADPELVSAEGQVYKPLELPAVDPFAYRGGLIGPGKTTSKLNSPGRKGPTGGSVVVYRVPTSTFTTNRPFTIRFGTAPSAASVQLDL
jgi:hypothetical protein